MDIIKKINEFLGEIEEQFSGISGTIAADVAQYPQRLPFNTPAKRFMVKKRNKYVKVKDKRWGSDDEDE